MLNNIHQHSNKSHFPHFHYHMSLLYQLHSQFLSLLFAELLEQLLDKYLLVVLLELPLAARFEPLLNIVKWFALLSLLFAELLELLLDKYLLVVLLELPPATRFEPLLNIVKWFALQPSTEEWFVA
jgi:hypothetical protein